MSKNEWASDEAIQLLSKEAIGAELAAKVAERLIKDAGNTGLYHGHRDYCGHGLICSEGRFYLVEVYDGYADPSRSILEWKNKKTFSGWLEKQSDYSLSGADRSRPELLAKSSFELNNQRLTKQRMIVYTSRRH